MEIKVLFDRLKDYVKENIQPAISERIFLDIQRLTKEVLENEENVYLFQGIGFDLSSSEITFDEAISIFDFLKEDLMSNLPEDTNLKEVRRLEKIFDDIENYLALGYLKNESAILKNKLELLKEHIISKNIYPILANPLNTHIDYFKDLLDSIVEDRFFDSIIHQPCVFNIWLTKKGKEYIDEEFIFNDLRHLHQDFHNLLDSAETYGKNKKFKKLYFVILNIQNILSWMGNEFLYLNTKFIRLEMLTDPLTKALNRRAFETIIQKLLEISKITNAPITLAIADLDHFKRINDTYGHLIGDEALKHFVNIIKKNLRKSDYVFRIGGEEFLILLPNTEINDAVEIIERIRKDLEQTPLYYNNNEMRLTASFGLAEVDKNNHINKTIKEADEKLYVAKNLGRNRVIAYL
jgi:diguanylate cyclase (GGDEF)-like protein